jgi:tetratricopeptide (TPR) repeat protein
MPEPFVTPRLSLHVEDAADGSGWRRCFTLQPLAACVPAAEVPALAEDLRRLDRLLHLDIVLRPAADPLQPWRRQAEQAGRAIARGHLVGEDLARSHLLRGEARLALQRWADALADADAATRLAPGLHEAWSLRGQALQGLGQHAAAAQAFGHALSLDGPARVLYLARGQAWRRAGQHERAQADLSRASELADAPSRALK